LSSNGITSDAISIDGHFDDEPALGDAAHGKEGWREGGRGGGEDVGMSMQENE